MIKTYMMRIFSIICDDLFVLRPNDLVYLFRGLMLLPEGWFHGVFLKRGARSNRLFLPDQKYSSHPNLSHAKGQRPWIILLRTWSLIAFSRNSWFLKFQNLSSTTFFEQSSWNFQNIICSSVLESSKNIPIGRIRILISAFRSKLINFKTFGSSLKKSQTSPKIFKLNNFPHIWQT